MIDPARVIILIPTYNEAENIGLILKAIAAVDRRWHILVLDDDSPDGTASVVASKQADFPTVQLLHRRANPGFAQSYLDGFTRVKNDERYDIVVTMDADFSHDPKEIPAMLDMIEGGADVVIGSRYAKVRSFAHIPVWRRVLSRCANWYVRMALRLPIYDCTSGFIAMRRSVLAEIPLAGIRTEGYGFLFELKYQFGRRDYTMAEHTVEWPIRHLGTSKMNFKRIFESARLPWQIRGRARTSSDQLNGKKARAQ
jgi:dolichol-phosphate mannosyltransferase